MSKFSSRIIGIRTNYLDIEGERPAELYMKIGTNSDGHFFMSINPMDLRDYAFITNEVYKNRNKSIFLRSEITFQDCLTLAPNRLFENNTWYLKVGNNPGSYDNLVETIVKKNDKLKAKKGTNPKKKEPPQLTTPPQDLGKGQEDDRCSGCNRSDFNCRCGAESPWY